MQETRLKNSIPHYSLAKSSANGNALFEIREIPGGTRRNADFYLPHRKDYYFFFLVKEGNNRHWIDFVSYDILPGHLYFTLPNQVHLKEQNASVGGTLVCFSEEFLLGTDRDSWKKLPILQNPDDRHEIPLTKEEQTFLADLSRQMLIEYSQEDDWNQGMLQSYLKIFLVYCSRLYTKNFNTSPSPTEGQSLVRRLKALIDEKYDSLHQVSDYAQLLNVTPGHLNDRVRQHTGRTATSLIHERITLEAKRLLFYGDLSVKEIAWSLGFDDAAYFNRFFKRLSGETPISFRTSTRAKYP